MYKEYYITQATQIIARFLPKDSSVFIFGSSLRHDHFRDIDVGIIGDISRTTLGRIREELENSTIPYQFDLIHINTCSPQFLQSILPTPIKWIISHQNSQILEQLAQV